MFFKRYGDSCLLNALSRCFCRYTLCCMDSAFAIDARALCYSASVRGAGAKLSNVDILHGVDLHLRAGEQVALTGVSGAGKTSLLMLLAGLERADKGILQVFGTDILQLSEAQRTAFRRDNFGIVFQGFYLLDNLTALENVSLALEFAAVLNARPRARDALAEVGLAHRLDHYPWQLSGGEQQRVALARACALRPKILLADEPTGNLDKGTGEKVADTMFSLASAIGASLLLVTHNPILAARCSRRLEMSDGRIIPAPQQGASKKLRAKKN